MTIEIVLTPTTGMIDEPLHGLVRGLPPGESATVCAQLRDSRDLLWRSDRRLTAGDDGVATLDADELIASLTPGPNDVRRPFRFSACRVFRESPVALAPMFDAALDGPLPADVYIAVERTNGPILLVSGDDDRMWPASRMGRQIIERLAAHRHPFASRHVHYANAGHLMRPPGVSTGILDGTFALGGTPAGQAAAVRAAWLETVAFLGESLGWSSTAAEAAVEESSPCR